MRNLITLAVIPLLLIFTSLDLTYSQSGVGKLSGRVVDAATGEPLIGANIILLNTGYGAATNLEGDYFILNITPGTYSVRISYVGYAPKVIQDVRVVANITYELNIELTTDYSLPEIVVEDRKFFETKATSTTKVFDSEQIARLPVRGISNIASLQSGVVMEEGSGGQEGNATLNVRGGRGSEVLYIVDGVPQNNLYNRSSVAQVSNNAIEQISFQVGGWEAKYGQAQSGIINVTTKSGQPHYSLLVDVLSSSFTDNYGSNLYSATVSGPILPGVTDHTIFLSGERGWYKDADPRAIEFSFPSINKSYDFTPNNPGGVWRFTGKTNHKLGDFSLTMSAIINNRVAKTSTSETAFMRHLKNNAAFLEEFSEDNYSFNAKISQTVSNNTFWNLNIGYRMFDTERYNPFLKDNQLAYGDSSLWAERFGVHLLGDGRQTADVDEGGLYRPYGWAFGLYQHREDDALNADFEITSQIDNHLLEFGAGISRHVVRGYGNFAYLVAGIDDQLPLEIRFAQNQPFVFGYDVTGETKTSGNAPSSLDWFDHPDIGSHPSMAEFLKPGEPVIGYAYLQDRFELQDIVLNVGLRVDYFDINSWQLVSDTLPFAGGLDASRFDIQDFKRKEVEIEFSPRIGIGFPITNETVFHAYYGRFIQAPELNDMYSGPFDYNPYITSQPQDGFNGGLRHEKTTQYEVGFKQLLGSSAALNVILFYKNIKDQVNLQNSLYQQQEGGEIRNAIFPGNTDFGTVKGLQFSFDAARISYFNVSVQYTYSLAEGTGSSTNSSQTAVFRNDDRLAPKVIAPLDFDQRHTGLVNIDFYVPRGELGMLEMFNANFLFSFNSGKPYTPVDRWNLVGDNGLAATTTGYINSAYGPGSFRIDAVIKKSFPAGNLLITPYIWIENLLDADNVVDVYRSTGSPTTTAYLNTDEGRASIGNQTHPEVYVMDYKSLENNPLNFGIPRLIKLGLKINFTNIGL